MKRIKKETVKTIVRDGLLITGAIGLGWFIGKSVGLTEGMGFGVCRAFECLNDWTKDDDPIYVSAKDDDGIIKPVKAMIPSVDVPNNTFNVEFKF